MFLFACQAGRAFNDRMLVLGRLVQACRTILPKFNQDTHLLKRALKFVEERGSLHVFASHFEEKPQTRMPRVRVDSMFTDHLVVCGEKRSEWKPVNLGLPLGATNNLVEEPDI